MKKLVIAEKPSVARDIARVLSCKSRGDGFLYNENYIVSWAVGHLVTLCDPDEYDPALKKWQKETLPIIPEKIKLKPVAATKDQLKVLKGLMDNEQVDELICATDSGREGELIFRYIYTINKCKKPFKRLWISSMTDKAITDGFNNLKEGSEYDKLYMSAKCRSEADWLVGINASRAFTIKYNVLLSIGRVQTPTLAMIVARQKEIDAFDSRDYWEIEADFGEYKGIWTDLEKNDTKIFDKDKATEIQKLVKGKEAEVTAVDHEEKKNPPPLLYDLTELQRDCNKKFGYSAQKTLSIAQDLYEKRKMITYPRTDSRYLSDDMIPKLKGICYKLRNVAEYKNYSEYVINLEKLPITKRIVDNSKISDHHALIPTDGNINVNNLSQEEYNVFDLVARRFLSVFYPNYIYNTTKIVTSCENNSFVTRGTVVVQKGWTELNKAGEKEKKKDKEQVLPNVSKGDKLLTHNAKVMAKKTKPPQPYNEASLLSAMENAGRFVDDEQLKEQLKESGLGTPATRAAIIERLIKVGYVVRKGKSLVPTQKAIKLIEVVPDNLKSPEITGKWEKGLSSIAKGKMDSDRFMDSIKRFVCFLVDNADKSQQRVIFTAERTGRGQKKPNIESLGKCKVCGGDIYENSKGFYCSNWRQGCKFTIWKSGLEKFGITVDSNMVKKLMDNTRVEEQRVVMPNDNEEKLADIVLDEKTGRLSVMNFKTIAGSK